MPDCVFGKSPGFYLKIENLRTFLRISGMSKQIHFICDLGLVCDDRDNLIKNVLKNVLKFSIFK